MTGDVPLFHPPPLLRNAHVQTVGAYVVKGHGRLQRTRSRRVALGDGAALVVHDDCPETWRPGGRVVVMLHGLGGSARSPYLTRLAARLAGLGMRAFRVDLRNSGASFGLSAMPHHSGRWEDVAAVLASVALWCPESPITLMGFSLGGTVALRLAVECGGSPPAGLDSVVAVCPPVELYACIEALRRFPNQLYDRHFARGMRRQVEALRRCLPDAPGWRGSRVPRTVFAFDDAYIGPVGGFGGAMDYYRACSLTRRVGAIRLPTLVLAAQDDPLIPWPTVGGAPWPRCVRVIAPAHGGHLGFINRRDGHDPDRRWMDWRLLEWLQRTRGTEEPTRPAEGRTTPVSAGHSLHAGC